MFQHHTRRNYPWTFPDRKKDWLRSCSLHSRWRTSVTNSHTLPEADCGNDHQLLTYFLRIRLRNRKKKFNTVTRFDLQNLSSGELKFTNRILALQTEWKSARRRRKHCTLAVVRSQKISSSKFNQLEMATTYTCKPSLVRIDARNFELSWWQTLKQTNTHKVTNRQRWLQYIVPQLR